MSVLLCHPGTQHSFRLAEQLERLGILQEFWTSIALRTGSPMQRGFAAMAPASLLRAVGHRTIGNVPPHRLHQLRGLEAKFLFDRFRGTPNEEAYQTKCEHFQRRIAQASIDAASHVIGFDCASWILADRARAIGRLFVLDRTAPHPNAHTWALQSIARNYGRQWIGATKPATVRTIESIEHDAADRIVVGSSFVLKTLVSAGISPQRISVNPYGVDGSVFFKPPNGVAGTHGGPIRFLFAGSLSPLKGMAVLLDAWSRIPRGSAKLTLVGRVEPQVLERIPANRNIEVIGPIAHADMPMAFRSSDVFVFPSLFDGYGLVVLEAMASGLAVIASDASAGPDLITDGVEGYVVPAGDAESLALRMLQFIDARALAQRMGAAARARALLQSWDAYGDRWASILESVRSQDE